MKKYSNRRFNFKKLDLFRKENKRRHMIRKILSSNQLNHSKWFHFLKSEATSLLETQKCNCSPLFLLQKNHESMKNLELAEIYFQIQRNFLRISKNSGFSSKFIYLSEKHLKLFLTFWKMKKISWNFTKNSEKCQNK